MSVPSDRSFILRFIRISLTLTRSYTGPHDDQLMTPGGLGCRIKGDKNARYKKDKDYAR